MVANNLTSPAQVLKEIEESSQRQFLPIIGPQKGKYLADTVRQYGIKKVLEVGTLVGYSAILIATNLPADGSVTTIEINPASAEKARHNIQRAGLADKIKIHVGDARSVIPQLKDEFDMAFIDAAKDEYYQYLKLCETKLTRKGIVFADNVKIFAEQMKDFLTYIRGSGHYQSKFIDLGFDGVEISVRQ
jgi:predicted O-methyltransferase YrrM